MTKKKVTTTNNLRDSAGVNSFINIHHEGSTFQRKAENGVRGLDKITAKDIGKSGKKESPFANSEFGRSGEKKG